MVLLKLILVFYIIFDIFEPIYSITICKRNPGYCGPYGECVITNGIINCECKRGYMGTRCQFYDPCHEMNRCQPNGVCISYIEYGIVEKTNFYCRCNTGYFGQNCTEEMDMNPCSSSPCLNNGICVNKNETYYGVPRWDYTCNQYFFDLIFNKFKTIKFSIKGICVNGFTGHNCGTYINGLCKNNKCLNDGLCIPHDEGYNCSCKAGYMGKYCEKEINECIIELNGIVTSPCLNDGICYDLVDGFFCECVGPYHGQICEHYLNPCNSNPCGEGSVCRPNDNGYICACTPGYFGKKCRKDPCQNNPCKQKNSICIPVEENGLVISSLNPSCNNTSASYVCICQTYGQSYIDASC